MEIRLHQNLFYFILLECWIIGLKLYFIMCNQGCITLKEHSHFGPNITTTIIWIHFWPIFCWGYIFYLVHLNTSVLFCYLFLIPNEASAIFIFWPIWCTSIISLWLKFVYLQGYNVCIFSIYCHFWGHPYYSNLLSSAHFIIF